MKYVFLFTAIISIVAVVLICVFLFANGVPAMKEIGFANFLGGTKWKPGNGLYGIFPMILGSIYVTGGALIIGVPIGILMSIFMARFCPDRLHKVLKPIVDLLAGIPSIVYGFFGLVVMVPFVREHFKGNGQSILTAALLLGIMILPTIISVSESSIRAVEESYYEGALGNQARVPDSIFKGVRTLTTNIVLEMGYATDLHREALIATGVVLFVFILIINISFSILKRRGKE